MTTAERTQWRVLVVDDEENLTWSLVNSLRKEGYQAESALTGEAAQQALAQTHYNCIISDVKMPGMDGFALLQWLRQQQMQTQIHIIMMTAFGSPTSRQEALRNGVIAYLEKPFDLHMLKDELRRLATADVAGGPPSESGSYDLLEIAQVLNLTRRDIALSVQSAGGAGILRFIRGELVWAEAGPLRGEEAFFALCVHKSGYAQPIVWDGWGERNVSLPISRLIYLTLARRDGRPTTLALPAPSRPPVTLAPPSLSAIASSTPSTSANPHATRQLPAISLGASLESSHRLDYVDDVLTALVAALPRPCGAALLDMDGSLIAQQWVGIVEAPLSMYAHLAAAAQAAGRALLLADLGTVEDVRITTANHTIVLWRLSRADRSVLLLALLPATTDLEAHVGALQTCSASLLEALN